MSQPSCLVNAATPRSLLCSVVAHHASPPVARRRRPYLRARTRGRRRHLHDPGRVDCTSTAPRWVRNDP
jgi:hypothetical protein